MRTIGHIVHDIQKSSTLEEALENYGQEVRSKKLNGRWVTSVFNKRRTLPILDLTFDAYGEGVTVFTSMGISAEDQEIIWSNWEKLPEDTRASWVDGFKKVDKEDIQDVVSYAQLLADLLLY